MLELRRAGGEHARECAVIIDQWISETPQMPRLHSIDHLEEMLLQGIPKREMWLIGDPAQGYISFNPQEQQIGGLYTSCPGNGLGKLLLDKVKETQNYLHLWSHAFNHRAHKFYLREGFNIIGEKENGVDGLPEIHFEWMAS